MSAFDPEIFLATTTEESLSTQYVPVPEGEFQAVITKIDARNPKGNAILDVTWEIDDEGVRAETGMDHPTCRQSVFLDMNDNGSLATGKGKNVQLGRLREALGQNNPNQPWAPSMLEGNVARVTVSHRMYEGNIFADVKGVTKIG